MGRFSPTLLWDENPQWTSSDRDRPSTPTLGHMISRRVSSFALRQIPRKFHNRTAVHSDSCAQFSEAVMFAMISPRCRTGRRWGGGCRCCRSGLPGPAASRLVRPLVARSVPVHRFPLTLRRRPVARALIASCLSVARRCRRRRRRCCSR